MDNKRWVLASRPAGPVTEGNFKLVSEPLAAPAEGEVQVKNLWLSLDPYMRGRMSDAKSYVKGVEIGELMVGQTVGEVLDSKHKGFKKGDHVLTSLGWQLFGNAKADTLVKVDGTKAPISYYLGLLGMPGMTAYFGLKEVGQPKAGETVVVSAASGAVGSVVGQLAKLWGCRAVGIAGGAKKCEYVTKGLGFDACVDYKAGKLQADLQAACPKGADVYFENVGGVVLETMLKLMNLNSRVIICGMISDYSLTEAYGVKTLRQILVNRIRMQGMLVFDWKDRYPEGLKALSDYLQQGKLKYRESVVNGLEGAPKGLIALLQGGNFGKQLVKLA